MKIDLTRKQRELVAETTEFRSFDVAERATELERQSEQASDDRARSSMLGEANRLRMLEQELRAIRDLAMQEEEPS